MLNIQDKLRNLRLQMLAVADDMVSIGGALRDERYLTHAEELIGASDKVKDWAEGIENDQQAAT